MASLLEEYWADVVWELSRAVEPGNLAAALKPIRGQYREHLLELLFVSVTTKADAVGIRATHRERLQVREEQRSVLQTAHEEARQRCVRAVLALDEALRENKNLPRTIENEDFLDKVFRSFWQWSNAKAKLEAADRKFESLMEKQRQQEAYFAQAEMLRFIREHKYDFTPRNFAAAFAGLPYMSYRWSIWSCRKEPFPNTLGPSYRLWEFVNRAWNCRDNSEPAHIEQLFQARIERLRKDAYLRDKLRANFATLRRAIAEALRTSQQPSQVPSLITTLFEEYLARPRNQVEKFLDAAQDT